MDVERRSEIIASNVADELRVALGARLHAAYIYGSAADGSAIPGFSDPDLAVFMEGSQDLDVANAVHPGLLHVDIEPFSYLQVRYLDTSAIPQRQLISGSYRRISGQLEDEPRWVPDDESLAKVARAWLEQVPSIWIEDVSAWSVAVTPEHRKRHVRLVATRLKPTARPCLSQHGMQPTRAYLASYDQFSDLFAPIDKTTSNLAARFHSALRSRSDADLEVAGATGLTLIARILSHASR